MSHRLEKINELLKQQLSEIIQKEFSYIFGVVSINAVITSADIKSAKVYISILEIDKQQLVLKELQKKSNFLVYNLMKRLSLKYIPKLEFFVDESQDKVNEIEKLLLKISNH